MTIEPAPLIDPLRDKLLTDAQAAKLLRVSPASICRYRLKGKAGIRLPWTWVGRNKVTTRACIDWWNAAIQRASQGVTAGPSEVDRELAEAGY